MINGIKGNQEKIVEYDVQIVGGGLGGLAAAERLIQAGKKVVVFEKENELGGLASSFLINNKWVPKTYHHIMKPDKSSKNYIEKYGLSKEMYWKKSSQAVWFDGIKYLLSKPQHVMKFKPMPLLDKIKFLAFGLYCLFPHKWSKLDKMKCDEWLESKLGARTTRMLFYNLVEMKFGLPISEISTSWLARRLHQSIKTNNWYGYPVSGFKALINKMEEYITDNGGIIMKNTEVISIKNKEIEYKDLKTSRIYTMSIGKVISTVPVPVLRMLSDFPEDIKTLLEKIKYKAIVSFVFASKKIYTENYWNIILSPALSFGGIFSHSVLNPGAYGDEYLYYLFTYKDSNDNFYNSDEKKIKEVYLKDLQRIWPDFEYEWGEIFKFKYSSPIYTRDYKIPPVKTGHNNIYLAGVYMEYPNPRTVDSALLSGMKTADLIINES